MKPFVIASVLLLSTVLSAQQTGLTSAQIEKPAATAWPTYNGDYSGRRYSTLAKINAANVKHLSVAWIYDLPAGGGIVKATPLLVNGVLYFANPDHAYAVEARSGRELWHYTWERNRGGMHIGNRGVAIFGESLFFLTPDCNLVSLDIKTGQEKWFKEVCSAEMMYFGSVAPVVIKDRLIFGVSGDDLDQPAYLDARNPETGDLIWRWYATPQTKDDPGIETWPSLDMAKHGGGMMWQPVTYDSELNLVYVTTGNPQPVVAYANREGANLFTASIVALNADTGKMNWYFQSSPHDTHDWDATQTPVLFDGVINGQPRKLMAQASRNGKFFVLDRATGKSIVSTEFIKTNWSFPRLDERGQPIPNPEKRPQVAGALVTPNQGGATNWFSPTFSPQTGLFYVNATRAFSVWYIYDSSENPMGWGGTDRGGYAEPGQLKAIDYKTGEIRWSIPRYGGNSGLLSTAGNVVFGSAASGIGAYNATTGAPLWNSRIGGVTNGPITYELDGLQYVVAAAGNRFVAFVLNE